MYAATPWRQAQGRGRPAARRIIQDWAFMNSSGQPLTSYDIQVALAWLLRRSLGILLIAGTPSLAYLHDKLAVASRDLPEGEMQALDAVSGPVAAT
jgi:aryl-alcohol dehydrogenase-like predicted oxidoreductase